MEFFKAKEFGKEFESGKIDTPSRILNMPLNDMCLSWARHIYGMYTTNRTVFCCGGYTRGGRSMSELRAYARGAQSTSKYDAWIDPKDSRGEQHMNISRDIVQIMPKFRDIIKGKMEDVQFDFQVYAIDPVARKEREIKKATKKLMIRPEMKQLIQATGIKPSQATETVGLESDKDIELLDALGGERLHYEMLMQAALASTEYESGWTEDLEDRMNDDFIDLGAFGCMTYLEEKTGKVKARYIDPECAIIEKTKHNDHTGASFGGYVEQMTLSSLRMMSSLEEKDLYMVAKKYRGFGKNSSIIGGYSSNFTDRSFRDDYYRENQAQVYDSMTVQVMTFSFIASEVEKHIIGNHHKFGSTIYDAVGPEAKLDKRDISRGKSFSENSIQNVYTAKWIVGTKYVFDCRKEYGIVRKGSPGMKRALIPFHFYSIDTSSIIERCIPFLDDIQLATLKKRNSLAKMWPGPRMIIDKSKLKDSVKIGDQKYSMLDLLSVATKEGIMVIESRGEFDYTGQTSANGRPIEFMGTGLTEDLAIFLQDIEHNINQIRHVSGLNEGVDGTTNPDMLVGVMQGLDASTNNSLKPLFKAKRIVSSNAHEYWMMKWQISLLNGDVDVTYSPIGSNTFKAVKLLDTLTDYEWGLKVEMMPDMQQRMDLLRYLMGLRDSNGIAAHHYFMIEGMIRNGRLRMAQLYIAKAVQERQDELRNMEMQKIRETGEANSRPVVEQNRMEMQKLDKELKNALAKIEAEAQWENWLEEQKFNREKTVEGVMKGMEMASDNQMV